MHRVTDATHTQPPLRGLPDWHVRRWLAAAGIAVCAVSLALTGQLRHKDFQVTVAKSEVLQEADAVAAEFTTWRALKDEPLAPAQTAALELAARSDAPVTPASLVRAGLIESDLAHAGLNALVSYDFTELEIARIRSAERRCLADAIYYESRNESMLGKLGVADVVLNRVKSTIYPDTICGVVYQGSHRTTGCQFSFTCDGSLDKRRNNGLYAEIDELAGVIIAGMHMPVSRNATHYHADYVSPYWAPNLTPTAQIGTHKFYRFPSKKSRTIVSAAQ